MTETVLPGARFGEVKIPASKSQAHRLLICAALGSSPVDIRCDGVSRDISATADCLRALGALIEETKPGVLHVTPISVVPYKPCVLPCGESGSTLRFLLPVACALGIAGEFQMEGRLPQRPMQPLMDALGANGVNLRQSGDILYCSGKLKACGITLPGDVSSQFVSGLLMALPLIDGDSTLTVTGKSESGAYITMTEDALCAARIDFSKSENTWHIKGGQRCCLPSNIQVEGDYSSAAFFLCAGAFSNKGIKAHNLNAVSSQGDKAVLEILGNFGAKISVSEHSAHVSRESLRGCVIDASQIPDIIPVLSVVAAVSEGETRIINASRLRLKESDRLQSVTVMLKALGADIDELPDGLVIRGVPQLRGGTVDSFGDHRIAMSAAIAACVSKKPVMVLKSESVQKSYPNFWEDLSTLKGEDK